MRKPVLAAIVIVGAGAIVGVYAAVGHRAPEREPGAPAVTAELRQSGPGPQVPPDHPPISVESGGRGMEHPQVAWTRVVKVPEAVRKAWQGVRLRVEAKDGSVPAQEYAVSIGGELEVPDSGLTVQVGEFLPALQVGENEVTSASTEAINPAVQVAISEGGKEIFRGWLFQNYPDLQPLHHPRYRITLVGEIPRI